MINRRCTCSKSAAGTLLQVDPFDRGLLQPSFAAKQSSCRKYNTNGAIFRSRSMKEVFKCRVGGVAGPISAAGCVTAQAHGDFLTTGDPIEGARSQRVRRLSEANPPSLTPVVSGEIEASNAPNLAAQ